MAGKDIAGVPFGSGGESAAVPKVWEQRPDVTGLCVRFGWLPSQAEAEDWAQLNELQSRIIQEDAELEHKQWEAQVRASWDGPGR